jgi:hypothetical protein
MGPQRVPLDVPQHRQQVLVALDGEGLESAVPDVAARVVIVQISADVSSQDSVHPTTLVAIFPRPEGQVEVIGHEEIGQDSHRDANRCLGRDLDEGPLVIGLVKDHRTSVLAIEDMVCVSADGAASRARHQSPMSDRRGAKTVHTILACLSCGGN